jgi:AP2-associated kinase
MRTEVETMKKLKGHRHIVKYIDSHASQLNEGGYEVFLLMEFCGGGGLIDFMNTRLQNRLTEPEIIKIFSDVAEGVACMHYLKPPLLHRDLKVENVLISRSGGTSIYKLCDFGSTAPPRPAATSAAEGRLIEDDVQRHTTLQYRSPEMIDVYRKQPIDEKSDIWALGVLLYKLCYYTTPFEEVGQMAILNASYKFPSYPQFSDRLKMLIGTCSGSFTHDGTLMAYWFPQHQCSKRTRRNARIYTRWLKKCVKCRARKCRFETFVPICL